jgi:hypothetical protein
VRAYRSVGRHAERARAAKQQASRELTYYYDEDSSLVIRARLPAEAGAVVLQALNAAMDARNAEQNEAEFDDVTAETLAGGDAGRCELENGPGLALDTVRRIACDGSLLRITEDDFPGCTHHRFADAHHIRHWANGGETSLDNLVLLCRHHHRLVHEGGFGVERVAGGALRFSRPDGRVIEEHPLPPTTDDAERLSKVKRETGEPIDASSWIVPRDTLDYVIAIEALLRKGEREACGYQAGR